MSASIHKILVHGADIVSGAHFAYWVIVGRKPRNIGTRIASSSEVILDEHLGHQRRKMFLICFWFPRIHLFRASENCLKRLPKHICQKHPEPKELKKTEVFSIFEATTTEGEQISY